MLKKTKRTKSTLVGPETAILKGLVRPEFLKNEVLADIFRASVLRSPKATAIIQGERYITYSEADRLSDQIAAELIRRGACPGKVVGLYFTRGANLLLSQIAITKSGATWLPFDSETPKDRIETCLSDCNAIALLVDEDVEERVEGVKQPIWSMSDAPFRQPMSKPLPRMKGQSPDDNAYLIYTSGSTGVPKGIAITHRNICHYLRSCNSIFGVKASDVMFQGTSAAFDLSMEEIWVPYLVGASLWVATPEVMADTENLPLRLREAGVTAIDTVPTLLSLFAEDVETLRIIIVGGEACPPGLVDRFAKKGRHIFNSYGPTEATVVATVVELEKGDVITIGKPIPNYTAYVVDENLRLVAPGQQGELLIGGPGVAAGYFGRAELTAQKFIKNPFNKKASDKILYRSGDAVAIDAEGRILFQGRIDDQVKIRGFRVELGEIETAISEDPGIEHAAVVLRRDHGLDRLVAFVATRKDRKLDIHALRETLRKRLPPYMVPAIFELIAEVPRLSSGKIDRKSLRNVPLAAFMSGEAQSETGNNAVEDVLIAAAKETFPGQQIKLDDDFFTDMGGHSMLAAQFISKVRKDPAGSLITLQDMYAARTLHKVSELLIGRGALQQLGSNAKVHVRPPLMRRFWCGLAQALILPFILTLHAGPWLAVFLSYSVFSTEDITIWGDFRNIFMAFMLVTVFNYIFVPIAKWAIIGRIKPGVYPLWGNYYFRVWLVQRLMHLVHLKWMQGTPVIRFYLRLLGAKIGRDALIANIEAGAVDLIEIGDHASIGGKVVFANTRAEGDKYFIGTIKIGNDAVIGSSSVIEENVVIGNGAELSDVSSVSANNIIPAYESWSGSPARKVGDLNPADIPEAANASAFTRGWQTAFYALLLVILPPIGVLPIVPAFRMMDNIDGVVNPFFGGINYYWYLPALAMPTAAAMVFFTAMLIVFIRWTVLPRLKPGSYSIFSGLYVRKWIVSLATEVMLDTIASIFATIYMRGWYRLMGAQIGRGSEISTNLAGRYDLINIGEDNFIADDVQLGDEGMRRNWMILGNVTTGNKVFIGNEAVVPMNYTVESGALIGVKSRPPEGGRVRAKEIWFGSPPIQFPSRQQFGDNTARTFEPKLWMKIGRAIFEAFNISLPTAIFITLATMCMDFLNDALTEGNWLEAISQCILAVCVIAMVQLVIAVACKWIAMGVYRPTIKPMWSWWALRTEAVTVMYWGMVGENLLEDLRGTPFLPWVVRLFGVKIGRGVYLDATDFTEFDCVHIGDFVNFNAKVCVQTHLYEDRLMKTGRVYIGNDVTIGAGTTVLYDTRIGDSTQIGPLTLVMKGEELPSRSSWVGSPAQPMQRQTNVVRDVIAAAA